MTLPSSGAISLSNVNTEIGYSATATISMNDAAIRGLAAVASGAISMSNFYGKSNIRYLIITSNTTNYNIKTAVGASYLAGHSHVQVTINSGIRIGSTSTSAYAMDTGTGWVAGDSISIINNGYIEGMGGTGAGGGITNAPGNATAGGPGLIAQFAVSITNAAGYIYSGGGGGGGGGGMLRGGAYRMGGGGGGGGGGYNAGGGGAQGHGNTAHGGAAYYGGLGAGGGVSAGGGGGGGAGAASLVCGAGGAGGAIGASGAGGANGHLVGAVRTGPSSYPRTVMSPMSLSPSFRGYYGSGGAGHGVAINGISNVTWVSGNTRVYGGTV